MKYKELLFLARASIESYFKDKEVEVPDIVKEKYSDNGACFVTLTEKGDLRGCIGSIESFRPLYEDVIENAINAAFNDPRFPELDEEELDNTKIEVSVLTKPEKLDYEDENDLLNKIDKDMGIILKKNGRSATFLPQVWEHLPDKVVFLENLCMKAGLFEDDWKSSEVWFYRVEKVEE